MKTFLLTAMGVFAIFSTMTLTSCKEDKCKATVCAYGGVCQDDGSCQCPVGYEGERCETITRDKFKGAWRVTEDGTASNPAQYATSIENGTAIERVIIRNFYNLFNPVVDATVKGDTIYIARQTVKVGEDEKVIEGKGYAVPEAFYGLHGKLVLSYRVTSSDGSINEFGMGGATNASIWTK
ncbi:calcium-binding EGF-like domain-containing protein [Taibaiella koreensis]|uniref:calcium-binding EGF-like domain-containing protein n=1 Tax=Taibaiella koreensis TaxID=1268548 RepID=UPI0013C3116B|nr:calcium-binding EGF-like domain-containing protein [Taibaiella koreensis]